MQHSPRHLEGLATALLDETGVTVPVDPFLLAELCGLEVRPWGKAYAQLDLRRGIVWYPRKARPERANRLLMHEIGHWLLGREGLSDEEESDVDYLALGLLLPRVEFLRDLASTDWDLFAMKARHSTASHQAIVVRMVQLSPATAAVWDAGKLHADYGRGDADRELVDEVLETGLPVTAGAIRAWPIFSPATLSEPEYRRVIVLKAA